MDSFEIPLIVIASAELRYYLYNYKNFTSYIVHTYEFSELCAVQCTLIKQSYLSVGIHLCNLMLILREDLRKSMMDSDFDDDFNKVNTLKTKYERLY